MFKPEDLLQDEIEYPDQTWQLQQNYAPSQADQRSLLRIRTRLLTQRSASHPPSTPREEIQTGPLRTQFNESWERPLAGQFLPPDVPQPPRPKKKVVSTWRIVALVAVLSVMLLTSTWYALLHFSVQAGHPGQPTSLSDLSEIKMTSATIGWAWAKFSSQQLPTIARTVDGGKTWRAFDFHGQAAGRLGSFFLNDQTAWVIMGTSSDTHTKVTLMRTTDGGLHWKAFQMPPAMENMTFLDQQHGWAWATGPLLPGVPASLKLYKTVDGGATWSSVSTLSMTRSFDDLTPGSLPMSNNLNLSEFLTLTFLTPQRGWAIVNQSSPTSQHAFLYLTQDGGATWQFQHLPQPATGPIPSIHTALQEDNQSGAFAIVGTPQFFTPQHGILSIVSQISIQQSKIYLYETNDGGLNWSPLGTNIEGTAIWRTIVLDTTHLLLQDEKAITVYQFMQDRWQKQSTSYLVGLTSLSFANGQRGWAYTRQPLGNQIISTLYTTDDGGKSWHKVGQNSTIRPSVPQGG